MTIAANTDDANLVKHMEPPDSVYDPAPSTRMLTYYGSTISYASATASDYLITNYGSSVFVNTHGRGTQKMAVEMNELKCKTTFTVHSSKVEEWRREGNHCA